MLYNFLNQEMNLKKSDVRRYINNQYINVFKNKSNKEIRDMRSVKEFDFSKEIKNVKVEEIIKPYSK